jgi:hypothetical protein
MDTIADYLSKTESATRKLFDGVAEYIDILKKAHAPVFLSSTLDAEEREKEFETWVENNKDEIRKSFEAQNCFVDESFAMAALCGSILQLSAMAIQKYSKNTGVSAGLEDLMAAGSKPAKFCMGRLERGIPIGLIIYAGRNQFNHFDDEQLLEPSKTIFERLCEIESFENKGTFYRDPAFDLTNDRVVNFASNITALLGWRSYDDYSNDMRVLLE